jgi:hypothetical protein
MLFVNPFQKYIFAQIAFKKCGFNGKPGRKETAWKTYV